ncbi:hypothetical protein BpHYR1_031486 [Brachionus plicatilis]|uniref:Uncharacterized protein n=1 Tax=Brachionus plicatilis TaxID=10195 RepID=A0A3M7SQ93_BRAPC|nr:hypothetical protein BpHYR1_031486 [Brachionus plicatilis]
MLQATIPDLKFFFEVQILSNRICYFSTNLFINFDKDNFDQKSKQILKKTKLLQILYSLKLLAPFIQDFMKIIKKSLITISASDSKRTLLN